MTTEMDKRNILFTRELRGREQERREVARRMLKKEYPAAVIAELTGLTEEQIEALR
jgi:hypothetical protein